MNILDWCILFGTLLIIVLYGLWKSREKHTTESFLRGTHQVRWFTIGFSIMATQASAITFLSAPGQSFEDGMRFVQFYFGLPLAMIVLCVTFVPLFHRSGCYTAYEYLEKRFDFKTRALSAFFFLTQRGLATSLTIYAPSLVLSSLLGWSTLTTNLVIGGLVIIYTVSGGTKAVSYTQQHQMTIILLSLVVAMFIILKKLPEDIGVHEVATLAGKLGKMQMLDTSWNWESKYTLWSGLIGGFFLALSYFGTDHSQVSRYLTGHSITESRLGLILNGLVKIPMQAFILFLGILVFVFYIYVRPPVFFNQVEYRKVQKNSKLYAELDNIEKNYEAAWYRRKNAAEEYIRSGTELATLISAHSEMNQIKKSFKELLAANYPLANDKDTNYIFLNFVTNHMPVGMIGLLIAVIFTASMSSTASALNSLASCTVIDVYKRIFSKNKSDAHYVLVSRLSTVFWGVFAIFFAELAGRLGSLIEVVNVLGSLFYGTILGIFIVAFYIPFVKARAVFWAAVCSEVVILLLFYTTEVPFLWYNPLGVMLVTGFGSVFQWLLPKRDVYTHSMDADTT